MVATIMIAIIQAALLTSDTEKKCVFDSWIEWNDCSVK
jgi:hypothetical protein